jgi:hypothetical protein
MTNAKSAKMQMDSRNNVQYIGGERNGGSMQVGVHDGCVNLCNIYANKQKLFDAQVLCI